MQYKILYIIITFLLIGVLYVTLFVIIPSLGELSLQNENQNLEQSSSALETESTRASVLLNEGDVTGALDVYDKLLSEVSDNLSRDRLLFHKANALFLQEKLDSTLEAIDILGERISQDAASSEFKAWAHVSLFRYYYQTQSRDVLDHIRGLFVFSDIQSLSDREFLTEIGRRSDVYQPTMFGKLLLAMPLVEDLSVLNDASEQVKEAQVKTIESLVEESRTLQESETWLVDPYNQALAMYYRALIIAATASYGVSDPLLAKKDFESAIDIAESSVNIKSVRALAPMVHLHFAHLIIQYPEIDESGTLFEAQVQSFMDKKDNMPTFGALVTNAHSNPQGSGYSLFFNLANKSEVFRNFLQQNYSLTF